MDFFSVISDAFAWLSVFVHLASGGVAPLL